MIHLQLVELRGRLDRLGFKSLLIEEGIAGINDQLHVPEVLLLLLQIFNASWMHSVPSSTILHMQVVARHKHELNALVPRGVRPVAPQLQVVFHLIEIEAEEVLLWIPLVII